MKEYSTLVGDLLSPLDRFDFRNAVERYKGDYRARELRTWELFKTCVYGQMTGAAGLREITASLSANRSRLYHNGLKEVPLSTLSESLKNHDWRIFEQVFNAAVSQAHALAGKSGKRFKNPLKIIDATVIDVSLSVCDWAKYKSTKGAVKVHAKIDGDSLFPEQAVVTNGNVHEVRLLSQLTREAGVIYVMDRGYVDFKALHIIEKRHSWFVTSMKKGCRHEVTKVHAASETEAVRYDADICLTGEKTKNLYPETLRMVKYYDAEHDRHYVFITNNYELTAQQVADVYKARWQVELFFKWLKQNLKVKSFWGTTKNAVRTQIYIALIIAVLLWIHLRLNDSTISAHRILQLFKTVIFTRNTLCSLCHPPGFKRTKTLPQLTLWEAAC